MIGRIVVLLALACSACGGDAKDERDPGVLVSTNAMAGPVPEGTIVDLPMDSVSDQDMGNDGDEAYEQQVVESDR